MAAVVNLPPSSGGGGAVEVRTYLRCWRGVWQQICAHTRRWPRRKRVHR